MGSQRVRHDWATLLTYLFKRDWKGSRPSLDGMSVPSSRLLSLEPEALNTFLKIRFGFPDSSIGKESLCSTGDPGLIPGLGRFTGEGKGYPLQSSWASLVAHLVKNLPAVWETWVRPLGWEDPLEKGKINHSWCSHVFQEANSLRRTMQIVECSLLHRRAQGRVSSEPRTLTNICENLLYPMCTCPNPPPQIPWDLHKLRKGKYNPNNPITHVPCAQTVKQLANKQ